MAPGGQSEQRHSSAADVGFLRRTHTVCVLPKTPEPRGSYESEGQRQSSAAVAKRSTVLAFLLSSQLCAGQKVVLYRRFSYVFLFILLFFIFIFFLETFLLFDFFLEPLTQEQPSFLPCVNALKQPNGSWNHQTGFRHKTF